MDGNLARSASACDHDGPGLSPAHPQGGSMGAILIIAAFLAVFVALNFYEFGRGD
jgi:hypothetical protein